MFQPKNLKFKKQFKGRLSFQAKFYDFNPSESFIIITKTPCRIPAKQLENLVRGIKKLTSKKQKIYLKSFPHKVATSKGLNSRMGKGKGNSTGYFASVSAGQPLFGLSAIPFSLAIKIFSFVKYKTNAKVVLICKPSVNSFNL